MLLNGTNSLKTVKKVKIDGEPLDDKAYIFQRKWQPSKEGLGLGKVLNYIGVKYD
jgi:hypothetical protein